jgi:hypothetical protein
MRPRKVIGNSDDQIDSATIDPVLENGQRDLERGSYVSVAGPSRAPSRKSEHPAKNATTDLQGPLNLLEVFR